MKLIRLISLLLVGVVTLTACSTSNSVKSITPLTLEEVAGNRLAKLSNEEREGLIYRYVTDMIMVDRENLLEVSSEDTSAINKLVSNINSDLSSGQSRYLTEEYANYLLTEFARTAYSWSYVSTDIVGFDPAARLYFADVTYKTSQSLKSVVPSSHIPLGSPDSERLKKLRYGDYINYLNTLRQGDPVKIETAKTGFEYSWGSVDSVLAEQQGVSLLERTKSLSDNSGMGKLTYSGLVSEQSFESGATMTVRFVFSYKFNLGEVTDLGVTALYLKDYKVNNSDSLLQRYQSAEGYGVEVLRPFIDKTIVSFHKATEETNYTGMYSLHDSFGTVDKYYQDINNYAYQSIGGYNFKVLQRSSDNTVLVQVNRINKIRARGANMSLPTYEEVLLYRLSLDKDDTIKIKSTTLVSSTLTGEPVSVVKNVSGISELIQYSGSTFAETNKVKVEDALKNFMQVVYEGKVDSEKFTDIVDIGISETNLLKISDFVTAIKDTKTKTNYLVAWETKTNVFVSLRVREIFETGEGTYDTEAVVDLVNRNGVWKVVGYTRVQSVKTAMNSLGTKNALSQNTSTR